MRGISDVAKRIVIKHSAPRAVVLVIEVDISIIVEEQIRSARLRLTIDEQIHKCLKNMNRPLKLETQIDCKAF